MKKKLTSSLCLIVLFVAFSLTSIFASPMPGKPKVPKSLITYYAATMVINYLGLDPLDNTHNLYNVDARFGSGTSPSDWAQSNAPVDITLNISSTLDNGVTVVSGSTFTIFSGTSHWGTNVSLPTTGVLGVKITSVSPTSLSGLPVYVDNTGSNGTSTHYFNCSAPTGGSEVW